MNYGNYLDPSLLSDFQRFLVCVNARTAKQFGLAKEYDSGGDPALGEEVEYFHFAILADDRMRYIIENIVANPTLSAANKIGNTIISHFYGARGIHTLLTGELDPKKALVDFERVGVGDVAYLDELRQNVAYYKADGQRFYGSTELHTSLQTAARNFCRVKYQDGARLASNLDITEWIASWAADGSLQHICDNVKSLRGMFDYLRTKPGVGEYYGYHCATSNSVNPALPFNHDERFCAPGPGARASLDLLFAPLSSAVKKMPYEDLVIWVRENQTSLFDMAKITPHKFFHNYEVAGKRVFEHEQNELKTYSTEVALCQFGVYCRLRDNPHLISHRKVARVDNLKSPLWKRQSNLIEF